MNYIQVRRGAAAGRRHNTAAGTMYMSAGCGGNIAEYTKQAEQAGHGGAQTGSASSPPEAKADKKLSALYFWRDAARDAAFYARCAPIKEARARDGEGFAMMMLFCLSAR